MLSSRLHALHRPEFSSAVASDTALVLSLRHVPANWHSAILPGETPSMNKLALRVMRSCGVFSLTRALSANMARILMYHNFSATGSTDPDALNVEGIRAQFGYLHQHFTVVPLLQIAEQLASGRKLDPRMVALTIDDGRRNCYEFLFPLLQEFRLPATFFVVSSFIRGEDWIWTDKVLWLSEQCSTKQSSGKQISSEHSYLATELAPDKLNDLFRSLNRMRPEDRNARIEAIARNTGASIPKAPPAKYAPCSWAELKEMADSGLMEIGSHTATHPILSSVTDEESWEELTKSRAEIEQGLGRNVRCFCYPNGMLGDFRLSQVAQVEAAGYICSVIAQFGMVQNGSDRYQLPRIGMARNATTIDIAKSLDGVTYYQQRMRGRPAIR
jgi:peptidoglycan/xylan/chitin deacetylase (PgdA/CDA1 family)